MGYLRTGPNISRSNHKRLILCTIIATGIASVVSQLFFIRELLSRFAGNEFLISIIIFIWLICGGIGTLLSQTGSRCIRSTPKGLSLISLGLSCLAPLQILAIRFLRDIIFIPGSAVGFYSSLGFVVATIGPYALLIGFVLPYSLLVLRNFQSNISGTQVFITDNIGDVMGGALFSFVLVFLFQPLMGIFFAHLPLFILCILLIPGNQRTRPRYLLVFGITLAVLATGIFLPKTNLDFAQENIVYLQESKYGRIQVVKNNQQYTLYNQGKPFYSTQDHFAAEEVVHYPLSQLRDPENILLISAKSNVLGEIEKYAPQKVDYVEIDPVLTDVQFKYGFLEKIPQLRIINKDPRTYLSATENKYDAIISSLPEPQTFQTNRFYTSEFFELIKRHLSSQGVWSFSVQGFANYLSRPAQKKISSLYASAREHFEHVKLLPGKQTFFLCSDSSIDTNIPDLLRQKGIDTQFVRFYYSGNVTPERIQGLQERIQYKASQNTDLQPRLMQIMFSQWFYKHGTSPAILYWVLGVLGMVYIIWISSEEFVLFSTGFTNMGSEILLIFAFQIFYGYIYYLIGLIVTLFLAGLLPGAIWGQSIRKHGRKLFVYTDIALILLLIIFLLSVNYIGGDLPVSFFLCTGFLLSLVCGLQFPVALQIRQENVTAITRFFSADIIGAATGALIISVIMIPLLGVVWAIWALIGIKSASLVLNGVKR